MWDMWCWVNEEAISAKTYLKGIIPKDNPFPRINTKHPPLSSHPMDNFLFIYFHWFINLVPIPSKCLTLLPYFLVNVKIVWRLNILVNWLKFRPITKENVGISLPILGNLENKIMIFSRLFHFFSLSLNSMLCKFIINLILIFTNSYTLD